MSQEQDREPSGDDPDVMIDRPDATGLAQVDHVIDTVAAVGATSLDEHVRVYEQAHIALRGALDDPEAAVTHHEPA